MSHPVNDEPEGTDTTVTTLEDTPLTFAATDFGFTDPSDSPADNALQSVIITTLPATGTLTLSGVPVTAGQEIAVADIPNLVFTPVADENGAGYADFTFQVRDDGGTADGGVDLDSTPNTMTIDVTSVNDEPDGADNTLTTLEDTPYTFDATDFGFTDVNDTPANVLQSVIITTLPADGILELSGVAVTAGQEIAVADIPNLTYTPTLNEYGVGYTDFTFQVKDDGGTADGGVDTDQTPNTITFDVTEVNDEPEGTDTTLDVLESNVYTFAAGDFGFTDTSDSPADNLQSVIINTLPAVGALELSGVAVTAGQEIAVADIPNLTFTPVPNDNGVGYADFTFQVRDDGGTADGGVDLDSTPNTITFDVEPINSAPYGADNTLTTLEDTPYTFDAADFGFSDPDDVPLDNNLQSVIINTLPATGVLTLSGVPVTAGQEIAAADIPNLVFTPVANENGASYADFTFQVRDDGGTGSTGVDLDPTPNTITFDVTSVNDEPDGADITLTTLEDTPLTFNATDFGFTDVNDTPANNLQGILITTLPANGVLELSGVAVTAGQTIAVADIPNLTFTPAAHENGAAYDTFAFSVVDDGGTADGGVDTDQTPNIVTIDVTSVNDEPEGTDTTVTTNENTAYTFAAGDFGFTDPDDNPVNNFQSVIINTLPATGALTLSGVPVTAGQEIAVADIPNLVFTPVADENGAGYADFTFQVRDDGGTADGGVDLDSTSNTMTIDVNSVNDAPDGADNTLMTPEDIPYNFNPADFGFTDVNDTPANNLAAVIITTLPADGILELSGVAVTAGQAIAVADIPNLTFTPAPDEYGVGYTSFTFQVQDDDGTANGGVDTDPTPNTITFDVPQVDDPPEGTDNTLTTLEDTPLTFAAGDFGFDDPSDVPQNNFVSVIITTLPANGILELSGVAVTAGQEILLADIPNLTFTPALNDNGIAYTDFTFQVKDDGVLNDTDLSPNTMTIDVTPVDDPPVLDTNAGMSTFEGFSEIITTAMLSTSDVDTADSDIIYTVTSAPVNGFLALTSAPSTPILSFTQDDLANNRVLYVHDSSETTVDSFDFEINDATTNIGASTFNIAITPVNDAPEGVDNTLTTLEDTPLTFNAADFGFSDPNDTPANNFNSIIITTLPADGVLALSGVPVTAGQEITVANIPNLTYTPALNGSGIGYTDFTFQVKDDGGTANTGVDTDQTPNTMTIDVTPVNDAPEGTDNTITTLENNVYTFADADFGLTDPDETVPNNLQSVIINTLPANGVLELSGVAVTAGQEIAVADIPNLTFTPAFNENGVGYADFTFQVRDDGGTANGGIDLDPTPNTITFDVDPVNSSPHGTDNTLSTLEDTPYSFNVADFGFSDVDDVPADNNFNSVIITTLPADGVLALSGVPVTAGQEISVANIPNLTFTPTANEFGVGYTDFTFQVKDDGGTANGGSDTDTTPNTITFDVASVNDAPDGADNTVTTLEDTPLSFNAADFGFTDINDGPDNMQSVIITTLPADGVLALSGVPVIAGQEIAVANIPNLTFTPTANENGIGYTDFTFQVKDDGGTANGGIDTDPTPNTMTIDVTSVNDEPDGTNATLTTLEDVPYTFAAGDFGFTDVNDNPANNLQSVIINTLPVDGILELSGVAVTAGQEIAVADIPNLTFTPVANEFGAGYADFTFQVRDDGGTTDGGVNLDSTPNTITFDVTSVNDAPDGTDNTLTTLENTPIGFIPADFGFSDVNDTPSDNFQSIIISAIPAGGALELSGVPVTAGQEIAVADIPNLIYVPPFNVAGNAADSFTFQVKDDGGTANTGVDTDPTPNTMTFDIIQVNDEPAGTDNTVTALEDTPLAFNAADFGFTDPMDIPANNLQSVIITTLPADGVLALSGVPVIAGQEIAVADIPNLTFTAAADEYGAGYADFTFQVRDDGGTANGGVDLDATPNTMTIDVTEVNDAPAGTDNTLTTLEDTPYTFAAGDFGFTDPNDNPDDILQSVIITTLPADGILELFGIPVTAGQEIAAANIPNLTFTPAANEFGAGYTDFTFQVRDNGGTADGGIDLDPTPNTITFDVTEVNDAPAGADSNVTILEDTNYTFAAADFGFTDPDDSPADNLQSVIISSLPAVGTLQLSGVPVTAGQNIVVADIPNLVYVPAADVNGIGADGFTFRVMDDGGTANGGQDTDTTPNAMTIDITSVNDEPAGTDNTVTALEDVPFAFNVADFGLTDPNDNPDDNLQSVIINTLPANGILELSGVAVTAGQEIAAADIPNLTFTAATHEFGAGYADFTFQVRDDGGTANGGVNLDATPNTMTIDVTEVNDEPAGVDVTKSTLEDTPMTFALADFGFSDVNDIPADNFQSIIISAMPAGTLELSGVPVIAGQEIALADIPNLVYTPPANIHGINADNFTFQVKDDGGTANGGQDTDQTPNSVNIDITSVNDAPEGTDSTVTALEDTDYTFNAADFGFTDPDDFLAPDNLQSVTITTLPTTGTLNLSGVPVTAGQVIAVADIPNLTFTPLPNENGAGYDNFTFQVMDDGGTANGGTDFDTTPNTMTIDVTSVNDAPSGTDNTLTILEDTPHTFNATDFGLTDPDDVPANNLQSVIISTLPANGTLALSGVPVIAGQEIAVADIPNLTFTPDLNDNGVGYADFTFQVKDDDGTANGGIDTDLTPNTITFDVTPVDDPPVLDTNAGLTLYEGGTTTITTAMLSSSDVDTADSDILYTVTSAPINGQLELTTNPGVAINSFTQEDLAAGRVVYIHDGSETIADSFDFEVSDATSNIGSATFPITVIPANDPPVGADNTITINEDNNYTFNPADFVFSDPNDTIPNNFQAIRITTLPANGSLSLAAGASAPGPVTAGQYISVADIPFLTYTPVLNGNGIDYGTFTFQLQDDGGTVGTGNDLSDPYTMHMDVTPVNDAPHNISLTPRWFPEGMDTWNVGLMKGYDVDNTNLTYTIVAGDPMFSITNGNILTTTGSRTWGVDPDTYAITLRVSDGALTFDKNFIITLIPELVMELPRIESGVVDFDEVINTGTPGTSDIKSPHSGLKFYIREFLSEIRDGTLFRYGNQGFMDSSLGVSDTLMNDVYYADGAVDEIIKRNIITRLQELASNIRDISGVEVSITQLAEAFGLDVLLFDMQEAFGSGDSGGQNAQDEASIYETNAIYQALLDLRNADGDGETAETIAEKSKDNQRQYLHMQLDEAAAYYRSKHAKLMKALEQE